jgi:hypothetical protein
MYQDEYEFCFSNQGDSVCHKSVNDIEMSEASPDGIQVSVSNQSRINLFPTGVNQSVLQSDSDGTSMLDIHHNE